MMNYLRDNTWQVRYTPSNGDILHNFYAPALACAIRYDRTCGYFSSECLASVTRGVEGLIKNKGKMRVIVGCTMEKQELEAIRKGQGLRGAIDGRMLRSPFSYENQQIKESLELIAWMLANDCLEIRIGIPCDRSNRLPSMGAILFHERIGIIADNNNDRLTFIGSLNDSMRGWTGNWESFHVFRSWTGDVEHCEADITDFEKLWQDKATSARTLDLGKTVRDSLLKFLPANDRLPKRLEGVLETEQPKVAAGKRELVINLDDNSNKEPVLQAVNPNSLSGTAGRNKFWNYVHKIAEQKDGEWVGMATSAVSPWGHQVRAFKRLTENWPPRLLLADEMGLGKTIQAGFLMRQAWLAGRAKRMLVIAPRQLLKQWQVELHEKCNLNFPIYDHGNLAFYPSPGLFDNFSKPIKEEEWYKEPLLIISNEMLLDPVHVKQMLQDATPWDITVLDEAHYARCLGSSRDATRETPNKLLQAMRKIKDKTWGLILISASPMLVNPLEIWDLLWLLGLPEKWSSENFLDFFSFAELQAPDDRQLRFMTELFQAMEKEFQPMPREVIDSVDYDKHKVRMDKIMQALRGDSQTLFRNLNTEERHIAVVLMEKWSPLAILISRHTRAYLNSVNKNKLNEQIPERQVDDYKVVITAQERNLFDKLEIYTAAIFNNAMQKERESAAFLMTVYRRRLISSFYALAQTLKSRIDIIEGGAARSAMTVEDLRSDTLEDIMQIDQAMAMERVASRLEDPRNLSVFLKIIEKLPEDSKFRALLQNISLLRSQQYPQVLVCMNYTDTMHYLRRVLAERVGPEFVICLSSRGAERWVDGAWTILPHEVAKESIRQQESAIILCTDDAASYNFQSCGALINFDMPWDPIIIERRICRIDRPGQKFSTIRIVNLMYEETVEALVYTALRHRMNIFSVLDSKLQPIFARLPKTFADLCLHAREQQFIDAAITRLSADIWEQKKASFSLDDSSYIPNTVVEPGQTDCSLAFLSHALRNKDLLPDGYTATPVENGQAYELQIPGKPNTVKVTSDPEYYDQHSSTVELWSPGSPSFPWDETVTTKPMF